MKSGLAFTRYLGALSLFMAISGMIHWVERARPWPLVFIILGLLLFTFFSALNWDMQRRGDGSNE